jgi:hypothetical protein
VAKEMMDYNFPGGRLPPLVAENAAASALLTAEFPRFLSHAGEVIDPLPGGKLMPTRADVPARRSKL